VSIYYEASDNKSITFIKSQLRSKFSAIFEPLINSKPSETYASITTNETIEPIKLSTNLTPLETSDSYETSGTYDPSTHITSADAATNESTITTTEQVLSTLPNTHEPATTGIIVDIPTPTSNITSTTENHRYLLVYILVPVLTINPIIISIVIGFNIFKRKRSKDKKMDRFMKNVVINTRIVPKLIDKESESVLIALKYTVESEIVQVLEKNKLLIDRKFLILQQTIAQGNFGSVFKAHLNFNHSRTDVAVKKLKSG